MKTTAYKLLLSVFITFAQVIAPSLIGRAGGESLYAQDENAAFYIYQNDGHFDGFFYDEVQKISYSFLDTLGIEHPEVVSQEIVTADSTYRIMLSAIDSVGFVQPEIVYNPRLHVVKNDQIYNYVKSIDDEFENIVFYQNIPTELIPKAGDVFAHFDITYGWSAKAISVEKNADGDILVRCKPIDEITDIFQRFVTVEEYGYKPNGEMARRRVAGRPDLTVGEFPRKASGTWSGDLFNFSLNAHIPLYDNNDLTITIDPSIEGKLNVKAVWNLSLFGDKYIGITTALSFGVGMGFSIDGKISDFFPGGIGGLGGGVPIPASCPIIMLDIAPDAFLRGEAHVKFSAQSPKLQGGMWSKLEINNWIPSMAIGFGNPDGNFQPVNKNNAGFSLELNGFVQGGMLFPLKFKSLPFIKKFFDSEIGGQWFVGPKLAGAISLDMSTMPWNEAATYNLLKNTKLSLHMLDADYEVKAKVKTAFSGKKEVTLADGSFNIFPPLDATLVPNFGECEELETEQYFDKESVPLNEWYSAYDKYEGTMQPCRVFTFEPSGAVLWPTTVGVALLKKEKDGSEELVESQYSKMPYYHIHQMMGQEVPKSMWPKFTKWYILPDYAYYYSSSEKYVVRPIVNIFGKMLLADPAYEFEDGIKYSVSCDTLLLNYDGVCTTPIYVNSNGNQCNISDMYLNFASYSTNPLGVLVTDKGNGKFEVTIDKDAFNKGIGKNYSRTDTIVITAKLNIRKELDYVSDNGFHMGLYTDPHELKIVILPNLEETFVPDFNLELKDIFNYNQGISITKSADDPKRWHCSGTDEYGFAYFSFDIEEISIGTKDNTTNNISPRYAIRNGKLYFKTGINSDGSLDPQWGKIIDGTFDSGDDPSNIYVVNTRTGELNSGGPIILSAPVKTTTVDGTSSSTTKVSIKNLHFKDNFLSQ